VHKHPGILLVVDVGGTWTRVAIMRGASEILGRETAPTPRGDVEKLIRTISDLRHRVESLSGVEASAIGLALGCAVQPDGGIIVSGQKLGFSQGTDILTPIQDLLQLPTIVRTEISMAAIGEIIAGSARGMHDLVVLTIGTGLGAGIIIGGRLYRGCTGIAGEIGHIPVVRSSDARVCACGRRGCLEAYAAAPSLVTNDVTDKEDTPESIVQSALDGDLTAKGLLIETAGYIGLAISICANTYDPEIVILRGGFISAIWPIISAEAMHAVARWSLARHVNVRISSLGEDGVFFGLAAELLA
jgi:glucokinase